MMLRIPTQTDTGKQTRRRGDQKSASVVKTWCAAASPAATAAALRMTPARWYSPTRRSKKLVFPLQSARVWAFGVGLPPLRGGADGQTSLPPLALPSFPDMHACIPSTPTSKLTAGRSCP